MKPHITTKPPSPIPWVLVGMLVATLGAMAISGFTEAADERDHSRFRAKCDREGGIAFIGRHGRACLWAGAVIKVEEKS